jgi:hypothetical protein
LLDEPTVRAIAVAGGSGELDHRCRNRGEAQPAGATLNESNLSIGC